MSDTFSLVAADVAALNHRLCGRTTLQAEDLLEGCPELLREPAVEDEVAGRLEGQQDVAESLEEAPPGYAGQLGDFKLLYSYDEAVKEISTIGNYVCQYVQNSTFDKYFCQYVQNSILANYVCLYEQKRS